MHYIARISIVLAIVFSLTTGLVTTPTAVCGRTQHQVLVGGNGQGVTDTCFNITPPYQSDNKDDSVGESYEMQAISEVWVSRNYFSNGLNDGHIWRYNAFNSIQDGISTVVPPGTVHVAPGIYYENIVLKSGVVVLGAGAGSDPSLHSIINGSGSGSVVTAINVDATAGLQGFTLTNGASDYGGGAYLNNSYLSISDCIFSGNSAYYGGGIYNIYSSPTITGCNVQYNVALNGGGGMHNKNSSPLIAESQFVHNQTSGGGSSSCGGGIYNSNSSPFLYLCTFEENATTHRGGGMHSEDSSAPTLDSCIFTGNTASTWGGGLCNYRSQSTISTCIFLGNAADEGGGLYDHDSSSTSITDCGFGYNLAAAFGGGVLIDGTYTDRSTTIVTNCIFANNVANYGGGLTHKCSQATVANCAFIENEAVQRGGGIYTMNFSSPLITNCTFLDNVASEGASIHTYSYSSTLLTNSILWGDTADQIRSDFYGTSEVTYCDVYGGYGQEEDHNINLAPLFIDAEGGDFHIQSSSPCVDAGSNAAVPVWLTFDFEYDPRIADGDEDETAVVDMGADETQGVSAVYYALTTASTIGGSVTVPGEPGPFTYVEGIDVPLTATHDPGYRFLEWTGDVETVADASSASTTITISGNYTVTAVFVTSEAWIDNDYVKGGYNDGHTWGYDAFDSIQDGINVLPAPGIVHVAPGTYYEHIILKDGLEILGAGAGDDPTIHSIIDGGGRGHVVESVDVGNSTRIDGFTILDGASPNGGMKIFSSFVYVTNCIFKSNSGVGMRISNSSPIIIDCIFEANSGEALSIFNSSPTLINCVFFGNDGGAIYNREYASPTIVNCTFFGNSGTLGGAVTTTSATAHPELINCVLWGNTPDEIYDLEGSLVITYSVVQGEYPGDGNIDIDPMFENPIAGNLRLQVGSPCIDAGVNNAVPFGITTDFDGQPRIIDGDNNGTATVDMGAYEFSPYPIPTPTPGPTPQPTPTPSPTPIGYRDIPLNEGWNLMGLPLVPVDTSIENILAGIMGNVTIVWGYDNSNPGGPWTSWAPVWGGDLTDMVDCMGYWIKMSTADTLRVYGYPGVTSEWDRDIPLNEGWNLMSLPLVPDDSDVEAVTAGFSGDVTIVWGYDNSRPGNPWNSWAPIWGGDLTEMVDCMGYWVKTMDAGTLTVTGVSGLEYE